MTYTIKICTEEGIAEDRVEGTFTTDDKRIHDYMTRALDHMALWDRDTERFVLPIPSSGRVIWYEPLAQTNASARALDNVGGHQWQTGGDVPRAVAASSLTADGHAKWNREFLADRADGSGWVYSRAGWRLQEHPTRASARKWRLTHVDVPGAEAWFPTKTEAGDAIKDVHGRDAAAFFRAYNRG